MRNLSIALIAIGTLLLAAGSTQQTIDPGVLLRAAIEKEEVDGDLSAAIEQYKRIIANNGNNRGVAAKALFRLGGCYEKLGQDEARKIYRRLIANYSDQTQEVALARQRLSLLADGRASDSAKPLFTQIELTNKLYNEAALSPDGQHLAFVADGSVWTVPVHGKVRRNLAGVPVRLTEPMAAWGPLTWSADGKWIAFNSQKAMFVIPSSGGEPKQLALERLAAGQPSDLRLSLSPGGKSIAYTAFENTNPLKPSPPIVYLATVEGGETRRFIPEPATQPAFSPDGNKLAYLAVKPTETLVGGQKRTIRLTEVWTRPIGDGEAVLVSKLPGWAVSPTWSPDGRYLTFLHAQPGHPSRELYIVPVDERGGPTSSPTKFDLPFGSFDVLPGWSFDNKIAILAWNGTREAIYTVPETGGRAAQVSPSGYAAHPRWSPDGERIYLRWDGGQIAQIPAGGGEVKTIPMGASNKLVIEAVPGGGNDVSPDGTKIAFAGGYYGPEVTLDIFTIPVAGGLPTPLKVPRSAEARFPCWSPDGKTIAFVATERIGEQEIRMHIATVPASGGEMKRITSETDDVLWSTVAWSPDGRRIAYFAADWTLRVIPAGGGTSRTIVRMGRDPNAPRLGLAALSQFEMAWSPSGKEIAYAQPDGLWIVAADGGEPRSVSTGLSGIRAVTKIDWSPDGKTIAFTGMSGGNRELWLMEDFLPLVKAGK